MDVRRATAADARALEALINSAFRGESSRAGWTTEADLVGGQRIDGERLLETMAAPDDVILIHERDGAPAACVHLERTGDECYLGLLTVRPTTQNSGIGRELLEYAERWSTANWSSRAMHLTVVAQRPELIAWYERRGYGRTGERRPFPYGDERCGLPQRADLVFEVLRKPLG
jgi:N-acetylglutamate synthase-like GNAT family acetyltransferase